MTTPNSTNDSSKNTSGSKTVKPSRGRKKNISGDPFEDLNSGWEAQQYNEDRFEGYTGKKKTYSYDADSDDGYGYGYSNDSDGNGDSYESFDRG